MSDLIGRDKGTWLTEYTEEEAEKEFPNVAKYNTSDDLISRADAIEAWEKLSKRGRTEFDQVLMTLPPAKAVQGWIPISERVPEKDGWYLVTVQGYETVTDVSLYSADGSAWGDVSAKQKVTAWMPLPKPYKGGAE